MQKSKLAKLIIPYLNHIYQSRFELLVMLEISQILKKYISQSALLKNCDSTYFKFFKSKLHHRLFSANITKFSE